MITANVCMFWGLIKKAVLSADIKVRSTVAEIWCVEMEKTITTLMDDTWYLVISNDDNLEMS